MPMTNPAVPARYQADGPIATVTLDRDAKRNAFDTTLADAVRGFIRVHRSRLVNRVANTHGPPGLW